MKRFLIQRRVEQEEDDEAEDYLENCSTQPEASTSKRVKAGSKGDAVVYNSEWEGEFPWLLSLTNESGIVTGMVCRICKRH